MRTRNRLLISLALVAGALAASAGLTTLSRGSDGPLTAALSRAGSAVASLEHGLWERASGGGRARRMTWFTDSRRSLTALRRPDSVLLGAYDGGMPTSFDGVLRLEQSVGVSLPLMQLYGAWGDKADQRFPLTTMKAIWDLGSVPVITWEPWLTDFDNALHPRLPLREVREKHGLVGIASGDYDFYIDAWAREAAAFGHPIFVRFAHEMNDPYRYPWGPQNNTKEEYISAWRHVVTRFRHAGA
ncbi:MAG: cellulase, partial [Gemmatimonadaceae bacterium]